MPLPLKKAVSHLRAADPVLAAVIERVGPCRARVATDGTHFGAVVRSIVYQQLSGKAAATIHGRVLALFDDNEPTPRAVLKTDVAVLRAAGLMKRYRKRTVVSDVSITVESGEVVGLLGPNGAGKTTCFYMILGLVPIDAGSVTPFTRAAQVGAGGAQPLSYEPGPKETMKTTMMAPRKAQVMKPPLFWRRLSSIGVGAPSLEGPRRRRRRMEG